MPVTIQSVEERWWGMDAASRSACTFNCTRRSLPRPADGRWQSARWRSARLAGPRAVDASRAARGPACRTAAGRQSRRATAGGGVGPPAAHPAEGQARHLALHGRRAVAPGDVRLQAEARRDARQADARVVHQGPADRPAPGAEAELLRAAARVQEVRQVGPGDLRALPAHRQRSPTTSASSAR